jgi:hypothetical protein
MLGRSLNAKTKDGETVLGWVLKYAVSNTVEGGEVSQKKRVGEIRTSWRGEAHLTQDACWLLEQLCG